MSSSQYCNNADTKADFSGIDISMNCIFPNAANAAPPSCTLASLKSKLYFEVSMGSLNVNLNCISSEGVRSDTFLAQEENYTLLLEPKKVAHLLNHL